MDVKPGVVVPYTRRRPAVGRAIREAGYVALWRYVGADDAGARSKRELGNLDLCAGRRDEKRGDESQDQFHFILKSR